MMQPAGSVLGQVLEGLGLTATLRGWRAVEEWPRVVGPRIAARTRAVSFHDGTLQVEVEGSAWLHEMGYLKRGLLARIHAVLGSGEVRDLRFTLGRARAPR